MIERLQNATFYGFYIYEDGDRNKGSQQIIIAITHENTFPCEKLQETVEQDQRIYFFADDSEALVNKVTVNELNPNLPSPLRQNKLKQTKRRPKSKGKRRTTQRAKPRRVYQTKKLRKGEGEGELNNLRNTMINASNEAQNEFSTKYDTNMGRTKAQALTLGNFI